MEERRERSREWRGACRGVGEVEGEADEVEEKEDAEACEELEVVA